MQDGFRGIWIIQNAPEKPDVVVYYCHGKSFRWQLHLITDPNILGGGFSMGSNYFYMEFLLAWVTLLQKAGFKNPALFALEYSLVPDTVFPTQIEQAVAAYKHVLSVVQDPSRICVGGDSAGGTLILSLLLRLAVDPQHTRQVPGLATLISPWVVIHSEKNTNTASDYLDSNTLHFYGSQYAGRKVSVHDPNISPGRNRDPLHWIKATPLYGWSFSFGSEEVLGPEIRDLIAQLKKTGAEVDVNEEFGGIHAWPVALLYLGEIEEERLKALKKIVDLMRVKILLEKI